MTGRTKKPYEKIGLQLTHMKKLRKWAEMSGN